MSLTSEPLETSDVYLDWNATTPPHPRVLDAMRAAAEQAWGNPASVHATGRRARLEVEQARELLASALSLHPRDVVLTSGGSEANNLALAHASALVTSRLEHPSVVRVAERLAATGKSVRWIAVDSSGVIRGEALRDACHGLPAGSWVSIQAANHETGVLQPLPELGRVVHELGHFLHVDAVQAFGKVDAESFMAEADRVSITAHKFRGPKGIGALGFRGRAPEPVLVGGSQERGLRPGTVDAVAAAGLRAAVELAVQHGPARYRALAALRDDFERALGPLAQVNGAEPRLPHVSNLSFPAARGDEMVAALDLFGIRVSSGSACAAGTSEPSPVITAMWGRERALGSLRVSLGELTDTEQMTRAKAALFRILRP